METICLSVVRIAFFLFIITHLFLYFSLQLLNEIRLFLATLIYIYNNIFELSNNKNERNFDISTTSKRSTAFLILKIGGLVFVSLYVIIIREGGMKECKLCCVCMLRKYVVK